MTDNKSQAQRLLDLLVYVPAGLAESVSEEFDKLAEKGRHRVEGQIHTARIVGQFAVQTARGQAQRMFNSALGRLAGGGASNSEDGSAPADLRPAETQASDGGSSGSHSWTVSPAATSNGSGSDSDLAIPGYDSLSASQVVQRLDGLARHELEEVRRHEQSNRHRRTILSRVDQLLSGATSDQG